MFLFAILFLGLFLVSCKKKELILTFSGADDVTLGTKKNSMFGRVKVISNGRRTTASTSLILRPEISS